MPDKVGKQIPVKYLNNKPAFQKARLVWLEKIFLKFRKNFYIVQAIMFLLFLYLTIAPLFASVPKSHDTIFTNVTLLSQFLFWGVWYGFCLLSVIVIGRLWCGLLCPLGALSEWAGRLGLKREVPRWVKWNGWLVIMFLLVTILGQTMDVRDDPKGLALLFLYIFVLAFIVGLLFGKRGSRPWCRYFCPIGKILGVVSRLGILDFKPNKQRKKTEQLPEYIEGSLCPTDYNLSIKSTTNNCITCGACTHAKPKAMLGIYLRKPGFEVKNIMNHSPNWSEIIFILITPGLCAGGFLWLILNDYNVFRDYVGGILLDNNFMWFFNQASPLLSSQTWNQNFTWLDVISITLYMSFYGMIIALILAGTNAIASKLISCNKEQFKKSFKIITYQFIPVAILSIIIGLCGKFFEVLHDDFNLPELIEVWIKSIMLISSMLWTFILSYQYVFSLQSVAFYKKSMALLLVIINILMILYMWWPAILGQGYMSEVEMIRQHLIVPGK
ncbi:hypothetical protein CF386_10940 [Paraphotobacterium marinum]|uniref:4Fe-4S ferredoxin-type domain-containing protein n=1 Tax=Paraphotobacterium marinum TaxID=1755811 RepID=A0A220VHA5_9GAMM|nr:4Fe-4S binding protein [Paraphotobacterium marinum]ASK79562.1 hypothetical protein CF386_10940 [Paraphotobacterium marinum]